MLTYIYQVSLCLLPFFLLYRLWLEKITFFTLNRTYLLVTLLISLSIPLLPAIEPSVTPDNPNYVATIGPIFTEAAQVSVRLITAPAIHMSGLDILLAFYWMGVILGLVFFMRQLISIVLLRKSTRNSERWGNILIFYTTGSHEPFSFFNWIFISNRRRFSKDQLGAILTHETAHVRSGHSVDQIFLGLVSILLWPSPLIYLYTAAIRRVNEYKADDIVLQNQSLEQYGNFLLSIAQPGITPLLANHFFQSKLKSRFIMMMKNKSSQTARLRYLLFVPVLAVLIALFAFRSLHGPGEEATLSLETTTQQNLDLSTLSQDSTPVMVVDGQVRSNWFVESIDPKKIEKINVEKGTRALALGYLEKYGPQAKNGVIFITTKRTKGESPANGMANDKIFREVDEMPRFPGCEVLSGEERKICSQKRMLKFIYDHISYPAEARENEIEGTVVVGFVVGLDGSIYEIDVKRSLGFGTDEAVISVVEAMNDMAEKWIPGRHKGQNVNVEFMLPVKFQLDDKEAGGKHDEVFKVVGEMHEEVFKVVEEMPRFPGCEQSEMDAKQRKQCADQKMLQFIYEHVQYPQTAKDAGIEGVSVVQFTVNKVGLLEDVKILRSIGYGTDEVVLDIIDRMNAMPERWIPGRQRGKIVKVRFNLPIKFKLSQNNGSSSKISAPAGASSGQMNAAEPVIFPNPASDKIHIRMNLSDRTKVSADIHSATGQLIESYDFGNFQGDWEQVIDVKDLPVGNYVVTLIYGNDRFSRSVGIVR